MALLTLAQRLQLMNGFLMVQQQHAADNQAVAQLLDGRRQVRQQQRRRHWVQTVAYQETNVWYVRETDGRIGARRRVRVPELHPDRTSPVL